MEIPKPQCSGQFFLAVLIILGFFVCVGYVLSHEIPTSNHDAVVYLLGVASGMVASPVGFYFGSSLLTNSASPKPGVAAADISATITASTTEAPKPAPATPTAGA